MDGRDSIQSILVLRKLTRAIADALRGRLTEHLTTLTPVLRPESLFEDRVEGGQKKSIRRADQAFKELQTIYEAVAPSRPMNLRRELTPPFDLGGLALEITPADYTHVAQSGADIRNITVRCPLTWTLTYKGFAPPRFQQMLDSRMRPPLELQRFILSYIMLHVVMKSHPGLTRILEALRFPVTTVTSSEFGDLPVTRIGVGISTERPSDAVIIESAELTGMDAFEEVVKVEDIQQLRDPLREQLIEITRQHAPDLVPS